MIEKPSDVETLQETVSLCKTEGLNVVGVITQKRETPDSKTLVGKGKLIEIAQFVKDKDIELVVFDDLLKPGQWKEITKLIDAKVIDRAMLILDIFARRAQSAEGKLKVELAQLEYNLPRLTEMDSGLSRLVGGIGGRGPGETKLEISRRRTRDRIKSLREKLALAERHRERTMKLQKKSEIPLVSIVGYTNAGKSSLFNALISREDSLVKDQLFATLDPLRRRLDLSENGKRLPIILADTVGFIHDLPPQISDAFKATIGEVAASDLLIIVVDASDSQAMRKFKNVISILTELGADMENAIIVLNKIDSKLPGIVEEFSEFDPVCVSALNGINIHELKRRIFENLANRRGAIQAYQSNA